MDTETFLLFALVAVIFVQIFAPLIRPDESWRIRRVESKLDLVLAQLGAEFQDPCLVGLEDFVRGDRKIEAIKLYRKRAGAGLLEAKEAVERWRKN